MTAIYLDKSNYNTNIKKQAREKISVMENVDIEKINILDFTVS